MDVPRVSRREYEVSNHGLNGAVEETVWTLWEFAVSYNACFTLLQLANISEENFLELMMDDGSVKEDVRMPAGEIGEQIRSKFDDGENVVLTVIKACGEEAVVSIRNATGDKK